MSDFEINDNLNDKTEEESSGQQSKAAEISEDIQSAEVSAEAESAEVPKPEPQPANEAQPQPAQAQEEQPREAAPSYESDPAAQAQYNPQHPTYQQPYGNPYRQQYQQPFVQPSQGYYQPQTNEYIYSPQPQKKKSGAGKALIIAISCILGAFVLAVGIYSALNFSHRYDIGRLGSNPFADEYGSSEDYRESQKLDENSQNGDEEIVDDEEDDPGLPVNNPVHVNKIRDYPDIVQLASPDDALPLPDIYDKVIPSVVGVSCNVNGGTQTGTGFVIDAEEGYIVTNAHVIEDYITVMIVDQDLNEYEAEVIGFDTQTDIAVLRIDASERELTEVEFGISGDLRIGELAVAIGNPLGFELYGTMTTGIISGLNRSVTISDNTMTLMQTTATINRGNSGGPLVDAYGRVIGITSAKVDSTYGEGLGFAIPIDEAVPIIQNLIEYGYVIGRPSIGISGRDINELLSFYLGLPEGVLVYSVTPGSGAEAAGILPEDVIIGIQGETISNMNELNNIKNQYSVGDTVILTIYRVKPRSDTYGRNSGESFDVDVVLGESAPD